MNFLTIVAQYSAYDGTAGILTFLAILPFIAGLIMFVAILLIQHSTSNTRESVDALLKSAQRWEKERSRNAPDGL